MGANNTTTVKPSSLKRKNKFVIGIINLQNDYCSGGALEIADSNSIIAPINKLRFACHQHFETFIAQDWYPKNHMSFAETHKKSINSMVQLSLQMENNDVVELKQKMMPNNCIMDTQGAELHPDLIVTNFDKIILKGTKKNVDSYSSFGDEMGGLYEKTDLQEWLKKKYVTDIILVGLGADTCIYYTALDALNIGYNVHIILNCIRGFVKESTLDAFDDLNNKGVKFYLNVDEFYNKNKEVILTSYISYNNYKKT